VNVFWEVDSRSIEDLFDVEKVREDFPILKSNIVYLDNAASSLTPEPVLRKMLEFYREYRSNVGRGVYMLAQRATEEYEEARRKVAHFINAESPCEVIMTRNTTEGINIVANGLNWSRGDRIVTTLLEHHSNFIVWLRVKQRYGVEVEVVEPKEPIEQGVLEPAKFEEKVDDKTKLVALTHVSNALGTIEPVKEIAEIAHEHGAYVLLDAAQSIPHMKVNVREVGCDFLAFSGHKMCAPTGSGGLYIKREVLDEVEPLCIGGGTITDVGVDYYVLEDDQKRFEAGTPAIAEAIGLGAAVDYLEDIGMKNIESHERRLAEIMDEGFGRIPHVKVYGPETGRKVAILSFNVDGLNPHEVAVELDKKARILVRSGHHCTLPLIKRITNGEGTVRASAYFYNTEEEIERVIQAVKEIAKGRN